MSYTVRMSFCEVQIPAAKCEFALEAIKKMHEGGASLSWVDGPSVLKAKTLIEAFSEWRYEADLDDDTGDIVVSEFTGEKLGDDEHLWDALGPFVKDGAMIECWGEDDEHWRWNFDKGSCESLTATEFWGDDAEFARVLIKGMLPAFTRWYEKTQLPGAVDRILKARMGERVKVKKEKRAARKARKGGSGTWERT